MEIPDEAGPQSSRAYIERHMPLDCYPTHMRPFIRRVRRGLASIVHAPKYAARSVESELCARAIRSRISARHLPLLNAARGKLGGTLAPIPKPMSAPQQPTPTFSCLPSRRSSEASQKTGLRCRANACLAVRFSPRQPHVWTFTAKALRKGPRNLLSCDQSVMAKTMSRKRAAKAFVA